MYHVYGAVRVHIGSHELASSLTTAESARREAATSIPGEQQKPIEMTKKQIIVAIMVEIPGNKTDCVKVAARKLCRYEGAAATVDE